MARHSAPSGQFEFELTIQGIQALLGVSWITSINAKASRQEWPYREVAGGKGRPTRFYPIEALPDEIQVAWVDQGGMSEAQTRALLAWPLRASYFQKSRKAWDKVSRGLCSEARDALIRLFPHLYNVIPSAGSAATALSKTKDELTGDHREKAIAMLRAQIAELEGVSTKIPATQMVDVIYMEGVEAAAGGGVIPPDYEAKTAMGFTPGMLQVIAPGLNPKGITMIRVRGDSMEPELSNGDMMMVARNGGTTYDGAVYVVRVDDAIFVKRVYRTPAKDELRLVSSNPDFNPIILRDAELERVEMIGQVIAKIQQM